MYLSATFHYYLFPSHYSPFSQTHQHFLFPTAYFLSPIHLIHRASTLHYLQCSSFKFHFWFSFLTLLPIPSLSLQLLHLSPIPLLPLFPLIYPTPCYILHFLFPLLTHPHWIFLLLLITFLLCLTLLSPLSYFNPL